MGTASAPTDIDIFAVDFADDLAGNLRRLRDAGAAVYLDKYDCWVLTRYDEVRGALRDWERFTSAKGVALLPQFNEPMIGSILASDPPRHTELKSVLSERLSPKALDEVRQDVSTMVARIVKDAVSSGGEIDAVSLGQRIPVEVVSTLLGLPDDDKSLLIPGADATFSTIGPLNAQLEPKMQVFFAYLDYAQKAFDPARLRPGSWGAHVFSAVEEGRLDAMAGFQLLQAYLVAGTDTTASALASMLHRLATEPHVWAAVKQDPSVRAAVFEETLRMDSPVLGFFRETTEDVAFGDVVIPRGSRVMPHNASANRDERHYPDPDTFTIDRNPVDNLAFGAGVHSCAGQGLSRIEGKALLDALADQVSAISVRGPIVRHYNPVIQGLESAPILLSVE